MARWRNRLRPKAGIEWFTRRIIRGHRCDVGIGPLGYVITTRDMPWKIVCQPDANDAWWAMDRELAAWDKSQCPLPDVERDWLRVGSI